MKRNDDYIHLKSDLLKPIGRICASVRIRNGKTQQDVADSLMIKHVQISKFESGKNNSFTIFYAYYKMMNDEERSQIYDAE